MLGQSLTGEITLDIGASAEPETCGSCKFYGRLWDNPGSGRCMIKLPKKMADQWDIRRIDSRCKELTGTEDQIKDSDRCDLHRPDGKKYIVQRRVG